MKSLLFAKFIPGFSTVAPPLAGAIGGEHARVSDLRRHRRVRLGRRRGRRRTRCSIRRTIACSSAREPRLVGGGLHRLRAVVLVVLVKWWQRRTFLKKLRVARVTADDLKAMFDRGESPVVLDVRTRGARQARPAARFRAPSLRAHGRRRAAARQISPRTPSRAVLYVTKRGLSRPCGAHADRQGIHEVRPLAGGLDAWVDAGYPVEELTE